MFAQVITVVVSALAATAVATDAVAPRETYGNWAGKQFVEECTDTSCIAKFNVGTAAKYYKDAPGFTVKCQSTQNEANWAPCEVVGAKTEGADISSVWTKASADDKIKLSVSHAWNGADGARYNATGTAEFKKGETSFNMPVVKVTAVL
ncbi:uncharacterized protein GGS22DRAFT_53537 [Annulohypoxylon maeteangense]|uniref:uncharacterized protein n=1 Tax=Annulohypoxylon maeteangense TaxID=1927788 RepID=UPI00200888E2|nr:uncharacterized protein GGS22DRAFT_53537 [Annulohypoxylon maeteangense]KAI0882015.1 hypothetical protein GGS22DRAFT_53537 [Annulohypoxylon maeteangense]